MPARTSAGQTIVGGCILIALAAIGAAVFVSSHTPNPAVLNAAAISAALSASSQKAEAAGLFQTLPKGLSPLSPAERFDPQTLSDKIDGRAELYLSAGFASMSARRFSFSDSSDDWFEMFVYEMKDPQAAYSAFSLQRRSDALPWDPAANAYATENAFFFTSGPYYVEILGANTGPALATAADAAARQWLSENKVEETALAEMKVLDLPGVDAERTSLSAKDAFGMAGLDNVFSAPLKDGSATVFAARRKSPEAALSTATAFRDFLLRYGGNTLPPTDGSGNGFVVENLGFYEVILAAGPWFAGVHEAEDETAARALAEQLRRRLLEAFDGQ